VPRSSQYLFNLGMNFLSVLCGSIVILCTATPPFLEQLTYPLRFSQDIVPNAESLYESFRRVDIDTSMAVGHPLEVPEIAAVIAEKQAAEGSVLAIMNTRALARRLEREVRARVPKDVPVYYLSTCLCPGHRKRKLEAIEKLLDAKQPVVCISTQLIEAGVDISFPCVFRALAGLDSILQAAGRCNRNGGDGRKIVYVVKCAGEERALAYLPEIALGQAAAERIIREVGEGLYGGDLQSPAAIQAYYRLYYAAPGSQKEMAYPFDLPGCGGSFSAVSLLGLNRAGRDEYGKTSGVPLPTDQLAQPFQTVGKAYQPIRQDTIGVLVPWEGGAELIDQLATEKNGKTRANLLRQAQRYSVNLFRHEFQNLLAQKAVWPIGDTGAYSLDLDYYDEELGVVFEPKENIKDPMI
jgi:CRISPR-associated endonuclease/helicase Cas3